MHTVCFEINEKDSQFAIHPLHRYNFEAAGIWNWTMIQQINDPAGGDPDAFCNCGALYWCQGPLLPVCVPG
jgi:hypothetical protein